MTKSAVDAETHQQLEQMAAEIFELTLLGWMSRAAEQVKTDYDLSETEFLVLELLSRHEPQSVGQLQKWVGVLPAQMSRVIRSLESKHDTPLITCAINPSDKRKVDVTLSGEGRRAHLAYRTAKMSKTADVLAKLEQEDRDDFMRVIRRIRALFSERMGIEQGD